MSIEYVELTIEDAAPIEITISDIPEAGPGGLPNTFETVSQSLGAYPATINYESDRISSIVYTLPGPTTITKTINYTGERVTSIVLSGATPAGISLTKTFTYTGDNITGISYS